MSKSKDADECSRACGCSAAWRLREWLALGLLYAVGSQAMSVDAVVRQRWELLLAKIEQSGTEGFWVEVDESSQEWQDLKSMAHRGIVFHCGFRAGGKEAGWHAYEEARKYFARIV